MNTNEIIQHIISDLRSVDSTNHVASRDALYAASHKARAASEEWMAAAKASTPEFWAQWNQLMNVSDRCAQQASWSYAILDEQFFSHLEVELVS